MTTKIFKRKDFGNITFGAHTGKKWDDLPINYLEYLISSKCNTSMKNKATAQLVLDNKDNLDGQKIMVMED